MSVPAEFSKEFYDTLGHRVAGELVAWIRAVDMTYRTEFRDLFDLRFNQLDAKLEQRTAELRQEMAEMRGELVQEIARLETGLVARMSAIETRLLRWAFAFWVTALGVLTAVIRLTA